MDTWTLQMGFPLVNVSEDNGKIVLTQQRFLDDPDADQNNTKFTSKFGYVRKKFRLVLKILKRIFETWEYRRMFVDNDRPG